MPAIDAASPRSTPIRVLETAERLFAERGIDAVSTREIARAAGQRNHSVVAYHFGSKEALIRQIVEFRLGPIEARWQALLAELKASGRSADVRGLVAALVVPFAERLLADPEDSHYIGFIGQLMANPTSDAILETNPERLAAAGEVVGLLSRALADIPREIRRARLQFMQVQIAQVVADWDRRRRRRESGYEEAEIRKLIAILIDTLAAGLTAPVASRSEELEGLLEER